MRTLVISFIMLLTIKTPYDAHAADVSALPTMNRASLGTGYDTTQQRFLAAQCIKPEVLQKSISYQGGPLGKVDFSKITDREKLYAAFGMDVSARARFGVVRMSAAAQFLQESLEETYSVSATFEYSISPKDAALNIPPDPQNFLIPAVLQKIKNPAAFRQICGDEIVTRVERGARLFVSVRATFLDQQAKQEFAAKVDLGQGFNSLSTELKKLSAQTRKRGAISVAALQLGGDPRKLAEVLGRPKEAELFPILNCSLEQIKDCQAALDAALRYAAGSGSDSFRGNIESFYDAGKPDSGLSDIVYHTSPWLDFGINAGPTQTPWRI